MDMRITLRIVHFDAQISDGTIAFPYELGLKANEVQLDRFRTSSKEISIAASEIVLQFCITYMS